MPHGRRPLPSRFALCLIAALCGHTYAETPAQPDALLQQAELLLSQQKAADAYALLSPQEDTRGGEPAFDLLLGRAAMGVGRHTEAAFAFERCLATDPKSGDCRLQMAQAHMMLGETQQARAELKTIGEYNPPAEVSALIGQYMGVLQQKEQEASRQINAYAQLGLGFDSNVNSANDESQIAIPALGGLIFQKDPSALEQDDAYARLEAGARLRQSVSPAWNLLADASLTQYLYKDLDAYNSLALDASLGGAWHAGPSQVILKANAQAYQLDGEDFRELLGGMAQYIYSASDRSQLSAYLQSTRISYDTQAIRDTRRDTLGVAWSQAVTWWRQPVVYLGLYGGQEDPDNAAFKRFGQQFAGLRAGGSVFVSTRAQVSASLSAEDRQFDAEDPTFLATREDTQYDLNLGLGYRLGRHLSIRPNVSFTRNDSNVVINDFKRHTLNVDIRYER